MGFDIMSLQKGRGQVQARSRADEGRAVLKYIDVEDLVPSEDNFYSMSAIDELAGLIELSGGVKQPGLVVPLGGGKYKVISGHRRRLASLQLVKQGKEAYRKMPCMVEDAGREQGPEADALFDVQRPDSLGRADFVPADGNEVRAQGGQGGRGFQKALDRVAVEQDSGLIGLHGLHTVRHGQDGPRLIVHQHHGHQDGVGADGGLHRLGGDAALSVRLQEGDLEALLF